MNKNNKDNDNEKFLRGSLDNIQVADNSLNFGVLSMSVHNTAFILGHLFTNKELRENFVSSVFQNFDKKVKFKKMKDECLDEYEGIDLSDVPTEDKNQEYMTYNTNGEGYSKKAYLETVDKINTYIKHYKLQLESNVDTFIVNQSFMDRINALRIRNGYSENHIKVIVFQNFLLGYEDRSIVEKMIKSSTSKLCEFISYFTNINKEEVFNILVDPSIASLLHISVSTNWGGLIFRTSVEKLYSVYSDNIKAIKLKTNLTINDYPDYTQDILNILNIFVETDNSNVFMHGGVGVGKTELAKYICKTLDFSVIDLQNYIVTSCNKDNEEQLDINRALVRLIEYIMINESKLATTIILIDEAEDLFEAEGHGLSKKILNEFLDTKINKLFISNYSRFPRHIMRRFTYILTIKNKFKSIKAKFLKSKFKNKLSDEIINKIIKHPDVTMHTLKFTEKVVKLNKKYTGQDVVNYINNYLKSINVKKIKKDTIISETMKDYNYNLINYTSETDLEQVIDLLNEYEDNEKNIRILLNGNPGTGKSEFCKYFAERLDMKVHKVYCSDILGMFVGQSEKNIKKAFETARKKNKILIFDEIDALLSSREGANKNWEVSQVNEFLQRLEDYDGIVLATTNTQKLLDKAAIRRFDVKIEFKPLDTNRLIQAFKHFAKLLGIKKIERNIIEELERLNNVCLGDFSVIMRNNKFNPVKTADKMLNMLKEEIKSKNESRSVGFM